jgi:hypothetical protein
MPKPEYQAVSTQDDQDVSLALLEQLRTKLPQTMREQLNQETQTRAYFLLAMLSDDACIQQLGENLQQQYAAAPNVKTPIEQTLDLVNQLQKNTCDPKALFKYRLPSFLGEYPIHSKEINKAINQFNRLIEAYHRDPAVNELDAEALDKAYQAVLLAISQHHMGASTHNLSQLLKALSAWSKTPIEELLQAHYCLLAPAAKIEQLAPAQAPAAPKKSTVEITQPIEANKPIEDQPFTDTFNYAINEAGRIEQSTYLLLNGFGLKPGGHADALAKKVPQFVPWIQLQSAIRRQLSQHIQMRFDDEFFDWLQTVLQRLGVEFMTLHASSHKSYVSPFLSHKTTLAALNEEMILGILQEQSELAELDMDPSSLPIISRFLMRFLQAFQFNRGQALGIGANWGGVVSDSNEAGADAFRFSNPKWAALFKALSQHRQGPAEARMNAAIGIRYELGALLSSFEYMTQLQPSEYEDTLYNALVDNLITTLFPEPPYFENAAYTKYSRQYVVTYTKEGMKHIEFFYQQDPQGTYYKTKKGEYKQTPMFRQAGSLNVEAFPRDSGSGECSQSLSVANPLWPLQLQYAQAASSSIRGHLVYNPTGPDEFIPDSFYGQVIRESEEIFIPFIGVVPKNFDAHFNQVELCASFVARMLQSSALMTYCPAFGAYYSAIATRFLPSPDSAIPPLPMQANSTLKRKWQALDQALHNPERTASTCHKAFMSLFKELIYSLYSLTKDDADLHHYFVELTTTEGAFEPQNRATCERLIRELTTLKPLQTQHNTKSRQHYDTVVRYLSDLAGFFYPTPSDETAKAIAEQAKTHVRILLAQPQIKEYFVSLRQNQQANLSNKVSPGLMHDAIKYKGRPSPDVSRDYYRRRHETNFPSGYRDLDGSQIVKPSSRESLLDKTVKTVGASLPLFYRNKSIFSLITQPFSQAYITGAEAYRTRKNFKLFWTIVSSIQGFIYGAGLGASQVLQTVPKTIYNGWLAPAVEQRKAVHSLAISAAPGNEPGLRVEAIMDIRDHLLHLMATANGHEPSTEELITLLLKHVGKIHPALLANKITTQANYKEILLHAFPLSLGEWQQLFEPIIRVGNNKELAQIVKYHALQIDSILIYALYESLTSPKCEQNPKKVLETVIEKHKLKDPQDKALSALVHYYATHPQAKKQDLEQYGFNGSAIMTLKTKERGLRKVQIWMSNALDSQWALEALFSRFMNHYQVLLNRNTLAETIAQLSDNYKDALYELLTGSESSLEPYALDTEEKAFLMQCARCYQRDFTSEEQHHILELVRSSEYSDSSLSTKAREHLKLTQFIRREWGHQFLSLDAIQSIIDETKEQSDEAYHLAIEQLASLYKLGMHNPKNARAFDAFYFECMKIQEKCAIESPLREWMNVTMNTQVNSLLDQLSWISGPIINNPLSNSEAVIHWLNHLMTHHHGVRSLLAQQVEQAPSFDAAALRCQYILNALETSQPKLEPIRDTGMQKVLRIISQNTDAITTTGEHQAKKVPIAALCRHSITMQHALERVKIKVPGSDFVRPVEVSVKGYP